MSALLSVLDQTIELCARHKEALAEIVRLRKENEDLRFEIRVIRDGAAPCVPTERAE